MVVSYNLIDNQIWPERHQLANPDLPQTTSKEYHYAFFCP